MERLDSDGMKMEERQMDGGVTEIIMGEDRRTEANQRWVETFTDNTDYPNKILIHNSQSSMSK